MADFKAEDIDKISELFYLLLKGRKPDPIDLPADYPDNEIKQAVGFINRFLTEYNDAVELLHRLSRGDIFYEPRPGRTALAESLKNLQASLRNLTWVTQRVADGDFNHKVSFMGEFSKAFNLMTRQLESSFAQRQESAEFMRARIEELADAMDQVWKELDLPRRAAAEAAE